MGSGGVAYHAGEAQGLHSTTQPLPVPTFQLALPRTPPHHLRLYGGGSIESLRHGADSLGGFVAVVAGSDGETGG